MADFDEMLRTPVTIYRRRKEQINDLGERVQEWRQSDAFSTFVHFIRTKQAQVTDAGDFPGGSSKIFSRRRLETNDLVKLRVEIPDDQDHLPDLDEFWIIQSRTVVYEPFTLVIHHYEADCIPWFGEINANE